MKSSCPVCGKSLDHDGAVGTWVSRLGRQARQSVASEASDEETTNYILEWQKLCRDAVFAIAELITLAGRSAEDGDAVELLKSLPRSLGDEWKTDPSGAFFRSVLEAAEKHPGPRLNTTTDILIRLVGLDSWRRTLLEACIIGVVEGVAAGEENVVKLVHQCPRCAKRFQYRESQRGKKVRCPGCLHPVFVP
jgi:hypothetical protein